MNADNWEASDFFQDEWDLTLVVEKVKERPPVDIADVQNDDELIGDAKSGQGEPSRHVDWTFIILSEATPLSAHPLDRGVISLEMMSSTSQALPMNEGGRQRS